MHAEKEASSILYFPFSPSLPYGKGVDACGMGYEPP